MKKIITLIFGTMFLMVILAGCGGSDDTIQTCIIANEKFVEKADLGAATQPESLNTKSAVYASIHFIESPKGMEYTVKWYLDNKEIKNEMQQTKKDTQDILNFELEKEKINPGSLKVEVLHKDTVLLTKEIKVK